jgi:glycosyltransferase involved in cell wall biosynthesis
MQHRSSIHDRPAQSPGRGRFRWLVSQIGARQHYGVPRGFQAKRQLRMMYTDFWCRWGAEIVGRGPRAVKAFAGRYHPHIPNSKVVSFNITSAIDYARNPPGGSIERQFLNHKRIGEWFSKKVAMHLRGVVVDPEVDCFFGFNTGCLETIYALKQRGVVTVCDQIDPGRVEEEMVFEEARKWPGWQDAPGRIPDEYFERLRAEWAAADLVLVNSEWSKRALVQQGVPAEKQFVVPVAYEPPTIFSYSVRQSRTQLTVLWLGSVNLRKGIPYLIEAAKLLKDEPIRFVIAGPIQISQEALKSAPASMQFLGKVPRVRTAEIYKSADVFVLPTVSDGFAITQIEAMGFGLPVVTTPNCGEVVTHGHDGLIVPACDSKALAEALLSLVRDPKLVESMSQNALSKACNFRLPHQAEHVEMEVGAFLARGRRNTPAAVPAPAPVIT